MYQTGFSGAVEILQRGRVGVGRALIRLAGRDPVGDHLAQILHRHIDRLIHSCLGAQVCPVFKMVPVAALVVHPGKGIAVRLALGGVRAAVALIIADAGKKLGGRIFGQGMRQSLPDQAHPEAAAHDQMPVVCDRLQMSPKFVHGAALLFFASVDKGTHACWLSPANEDNDASRHFAP